MVMAVTLLFYGVALAFLALEDMRRFEIKLEVLPVVVALGSFLNWSIGLSLVDVLGGGLIWGVPVALYCRFFPGRIGQGDIWLFTAAGLCFGVSGSLLGGGLFGLASVLTAWRYAHVRGKRFGASIFPAALPMATALLFSCVWQRVQSAFEAGAISNWALATVALPLVGVALGMAACTHLASSQSKSTCQCHSISATNVSDAEAANDS